MKTYPSFMKKYLMMTISVVMRDLHPIKSLLVYRLVTYISVKWVGLLSLSEFSKRGKSQQIGH